MTDNPFELRFQNLSNKILDYKKVNLNPTKSNFWFSNKARVGSWGCHQQITRKKLMESMACLGSQVGINLEKMSLASTKTSDSESEKRAKNMTMSQLSPTILTLEWLKTFTKSLKEEARPSKTKNPNPTNLA